MRTFVDGNLTVMAPDFGAWLQEKNVLRIHVDGGGTVTLRKNDENLATYTLDANGDAIVEISDLLNVSELPCSLYITSQEGRTTGAMPFMRAGLINPLHVLIPESVSGLYIQAPSMMHEPIAQGLIKTEFMSLAESIGIFTTSDTPLKLKVGQLVPFQVPAHLTLNKLTIAELLQENAIHAGSYTFQYDGVESVAVAPHRWRHNDELVYTIGRNPRSGVDDAYNDPDAQSVYYKVNGEYWDTDTLQTIMPLRNECGKRYAAVRWVSFTGNERIHTWEVTKAKTATRDTTELLTIDGSYNTIKGREDGFVLRLEGLNAYDMWYYADIITSSKVEVSMDGTEWQRVDITTKDITIPDGDAGKLNTLEVNCNWRKYDAITL